MEDWTKREEYRNPCNIWEQSMVLEEIEAQGKRNKQLMDGIANNLKQYEKDIRKQVCDEIWIEFEQRLMNKTEDMPVINVAHMINSVIDKIKSKDS